MNRRRTWTPDRLGWLAALVTGWAVAALSRFSDGAISVVPDMVVLYVGAAGAGMTTLVWIIAGSARRAAAPDGRRRWPWLLYAAVLIAVVPSLCRYGVPFRARLAASEAALVDAARAAVATGPRWIGLLRIDRVEIVGGVPRFHLGACGLSERCALAYSPDRRPQPFTDGERYQRLRGPWWNVVVPF